MGKACPPRDAAPQFAERPPHAQSMMVAALPAMDAAQSAARVSGMPSWEHFPHAADIGIRGIGRTRLQAFEQAALALTAVVTEPEKVRASHRIEFTCSGNDDEFLFLDWINALIFEMSTRDMLFSRFKLSIDGATLVASAWGEPVDIARHAPAVEPKGATLTELKVGQERNGVWTAQCVVDV